MGDPRSIRRELEDSLRRLRVERMFLRAGLDSVLLGAAVAEGRNTLLDMGCGVGTAAFVAMTHNAGIAATLADRNADMAALAQANAAENGTAATDANINE